MPVIAGAVKKAPKGLRPWISFLKKHVGKGYTREELVRIFRREHGTSRKKKSKKRTKKKKNTKKKEQEEEKRMNLNDESE